LQRRRRRDQSQAGRSSPVDLIADPDRLRELAVEILASSSSPDRAYGATARYGLGTLSMSARI
jgi:hypothetical protein